MRKMIVSAVGLAACLAAMPAQAAPPAKAGPELVELKKIAVVDFERCIKETKKGIAANKKIVEWMKNAEGRLAAKEKELRKLYEDLQAKASMLSPAEIERRQAELMRRDQEMQALVAETQEWQATKENELVGTMLSSVGGIVETIAKSEDIQLVLIRSDATVLYVNPKLDLTNRVIVEHDKKK